MIYSIEYSIIQVIPCLFGMNSTDTKRKATVLKIHKNLVAQLTEAVEYIDCISAEG